ncbi:MULTISPECIES: SRPBCC domain-containing protein [unclassified Paenarthrobacter]|uniref:SRPBCC family protein n=1 Tax=unclassified Paenarthrobacter TaxID=2634190 RepID=UPI001F1E17E0|nr:SRPBCC domain-containing protein [Paenarthrobacter sp. AR 02]MCF3139858.1 SRPBCC domain-containing protein [Paenarthrobacter sp. AR 02]
MTPSAEDAAAGLQYSRVLDAPPELVFDCFTQPGHLTHFWAPKGASAPTTEILVDLRPGGRFETLIVNDATGATYATRSVFLEVHAPDILAWHEEHTGMTVRVTFTALPGGRTLFSLHQSDIPDQVLRPENRAGFATTLDKLSNYLHHLADGAKQ